MLKIKGLITALITPFNSDGSLSEKGLRDNIRDQITAGVDGVVVLGTTGESPTLTKEERLRVLSCAKEETEGKISLTVGTGSNCTATAIEQTRLAKDFGADAALIVTPYYNRPMQKGLFQHYNSIADAVDLPIILYNVPARTGVSLTLDTIKSLAKHPRIVGLKEASGSLPFAVNAIESTELTVFSGDDALTYPMMSHGASGVISVASNLLPALMRSLVYAPDHSAAEIHNRLLPLFKALSLETNPIPIKAAMEYLDLPSGPCRLPLSEMDMATKQKLLKILESFKPVASS